MLACILFIYNFIMKAELHFNLNDAEDSMAHTRCLKSTEMALMLWELMHNSKKSLEWKMESNSIDRYDALDMVFERINELLEEYDINVDKLIN